MELASKAVLLSAVVTVLTVILYIVMLMRVGAARGKYKVEAPATTGHPVFERTYRVQMNTIENLVIFFPALWLATLYFTTWGWLPPALGFFWIVGRILYMEGYIADPAKRSTGFLISALAQIVLLVLAIIGIVQAWMAAG